MQLLLTACRIRILSRDFKQVLMSVEYKVYGIEERFQEKEKEYFEAKKEKIWRVF